MAAREGWHSAQGRAFGGPLKYIQRAGEIDRLAEIEETARFCQSVGLPTTLADLKLGKAAVADIERVAKAALKEGSITWRVAVPLSVEIVRDAFTSQLFGTERQAR